MDGYAPKRAKPGDTVVLRTGTIMDADLDFYANGVKLENTHNDSDYWEYTFIMPDEDVVITHKMSDGFIQGECEDHVDEDANGTCDNCGHKIEHEHTGEWYMNEKIHFYEYTCGCESPDIAELHLDSDNNGFCDICEYEMPEIVSPTNYFLRDQLGAEWIKEITAEDIAEIKIISEAVGVAPGSLKKLTSSTDEAVIARIFGDCHFCEILSIPKSEGQIDGGGAVTVKFILKDGTVKALYINNGNYCDPNGNYFELLHTPHFEDTDNKSEYYGFITYIGRGTVYDKDNNTVCEIPINELEYVITGYDFSLFNNGYDYCVDTEFGKLYFVKFEIFASEGDGLELVRVDYYFIAENDTEFCYRLVGKNLDELIAEYSITAE